MKRYSGILALLWLSFFVTNTISAQNTTHLNTWAKLNLSYNINKRLKLDAEYHHRRQNDFAENTENPLQYDLMSAVRFLGTYQINDNASVTVSPFAYFWNTPIIQTENDKTKPVIKEVRYSAFLDLKQPIYGHLAVFSKTGLEYRDFRNVLSDVWRFRNRLGLRYEQNRWSLSLWDEVMLNVKRSDAAHIFDHNRIGLIGGFKINKAVKIEMGYIRIARLLRNSSDLIDENNVVLNLYYNIPTIKSHKSKT